MVLEDLESRFRSARRPRQTNDTASHLRELNRLSRVAITRISFVDETPSCHTDLLGQFVGDRFGEVAIGNGFVEEMLGLVLNAVQPCGGTEKL